MDKTEKFSWRVEPQLKSELEAVAREESTTVTEVLRRASLEYLKKRRKKADPVVDAKEKARQKAVLDSIVDNARRRDPGGPPTPSATNENIRNAFAEKFDADAKKRNAPRSR
jgi:hypothetical protein